MTEIITKEYRLKITGTSEEHKLVETLIKDFADEMCCKLSGLYSEIEYYVQQFMDHKNNKPGELPMIETLEENIIIKV
jgi:hypothetical protein